MCEVFRESESKTGAYSLKFCKAETKILGRNVVLVKTKTFRKLIPQLSCNPTLTIVLN